MDSSIANEPALAATISVLVSVSMLNGSSISVYLVGLPMHMSPLALGIIEVLFQKFSLEGNEMEFETLTMPELIGDTSLGLIKEKIRMAPSAM